MRMMLRAVMDTAKGNASLESGKMPQVIEKVMEQLKPEAAYFTAHQGRRSCIMVFDMQDSSQLPSIAEPFFSTFGAEIEVQPAMTADDLRKGLSSVTR